MQKVKLNIVPKGVKKTTYLSQNDNGRVVRYELFNELIPYILDGSETITLKVVRPDGEEILANIENTFEGEAYIDVSFNDDMSAITGVGAGEIKITDGETELGSHNFDINVEIDAYNGKDVVIETETGTLLSFNTEVEDNALEYESEIPYNAEGYSGLRVINTRTAPVYDKTPYLFRKTPDGSGNSCIEKLTGLSVAFNQLVQNGNFESTSGWYGTRCNITANNNELTAEVTDVSANVPQNVRIYRSDYNFVYNHKYFVTFNVYPKYNSVKCIYIDQRENIKNFNVTANVINKCSTIINSQYNTSFLWFGLGMNSANGYSIGDTDKISNVNIIDLTAFFGSSTIADYLYNLETQTAGAGVALFKSLGFDKPYYEYNAGSLLSSKPTSKKVVGFNQWDEETVVGGYYDASGVWQENPNILSSKNFIKVFPNTSYYVKSPENIGLAITFWSLSGDFIERRSVQQNSVVTTPINCGYIAFNMSNAYGTTYNHDICINISDPDKNGTYEPYSEDTYNLGGDELRGLLKLDANNNIFAYGDTKTSDGNIERKFGIVDLGSLSYTLYTVTEGNLFRARIDEGYLPDNTLNLVCAKYVTTTSNGRSNKTISVGSVGRIDIIDDDYSDKDAFKTAMNGVYLVYELATPTSESADPYTDPQEARITEEFIDDRAIPIPVGHDTIYGTDIEYQDIDFDTTIFGGNINAIDGVLSSEYNSDGSVKPTPEIIDITPTPIPVKAGDNKIFNSASGNQTIRYYNQVEE